MEWIYSDGGRSKYFKGKAGDCVVRSICNATGLDYKMVYDDINTLAKCEHTGKRKKGISNSRSGVYKGTFKKYINSLGYKWVSCMGIGTGCQVHLNENELPNDKSLIVLVSGHNTCVKNGKLYDTYDCTRDGKRCVYGYWVVE